MRPGNGRSGTEYPWILVPQLRGLPGRTGTESTEGSRFPYLENGRSSGETGERKKRNGIPVDFSTSAEGPPRKNGNGINGTESP